ncbi:PREDICTED: calcium-binding tyrosine phosphorylation-regulated protein [Chaetura pelagica]|uniref:calcium-binding tyrosine phosphorylation-regulated protein n=1 Tax=Chaetura pelagica TaxID=8897 RepID=UPI0005232EEA|nr:PREDICTED: calcium-binding tyrosine phosphorylation-regulated protein [Chaetura pelagica]
MQCPQIALVVPPGLEALLEAVTRAVLERNPENMIEFFSLYFQELVSFQKGRKSTPESDGALSPAAQELSSSDSLCSVKDVATSVQTLEEDSQASEGERTPVEEAAEDAPPVAPARASVESVKSQPSTAGKQGPSDTQADVSTTDENKAPSVVPLQEEPAPPALPEDTSEPVPICSKGKVPSATGALSVCWGGGTITDAELPPRLEQFPQERIIPFVDQTASLEAVTTSEDSSVLSSGDVLQSPAAVLVLHIGQRLLVERESRPLENGDEGLEMKTSELPVESKQKDVCADREDDHLPEEPNIQYSSKETQYPSVAGSIGGSKSTPGSDGALSPAEPEPACVPAEPAQPAEPAPLAEDVRGSSDSLCSVKDVATSVQTLEEDSQASEGERTPVEEAAEDAPPVAPARASVESVKSQPSTAGKQGPSDTQADVSTTDENKAPSVVPLQEEPAPPALPEDTSEPVPICSKGKVPSATGALSVCWGGGTITDAELPPRLEQFPQERIIPFVDQTASLEAENGDEGLQEKASELPEESEQKDVCTDTAEDHLFEEPDIQYSSQETQCPSVPASVAGRKSSLGTDGASFPAGPELAYVPAEPAQLAEHVRAMASSAAGQPPPHSNVWTLYCLTDLRQGQKPPPSLPSAGAGVAYFQATLCPSRGGDQHCAPIYVVQEDGKKGDAPPFILVGSNVQNTQDWKPVPSHAVFVQQDAGARKRLTTVPIPVARPADEETDSSKSAEETGAKPCTPTVVSVAIPLADVMAAKRGSPAGEKHTGINALAESSGAAG